MSCFALVDVEEVSSKAEAEHLLFIHQTLAVTPGGSIHPLNLAFDLFLHITEETVLRVVFLLGTPQIQCVLNVSEEFASVFVE